MLSSLKRYFLPLLSFLRVDSVLESTPLCEGHVRVTGRSLRSMWGEYFHLEYPIDGWVDTDHMGQLRLLPGGI